MFFYSERPKTLAERKYEDNIPEKIKRARLQKVIDLQREHSVINHNKERVLLKFSIPDKSFEQVAKEINYVVPHDLSS